MSMSAFEGTQFSHVDYISIYIFYLDLHLTLSFTDHY